MSREQVMRKRGFTEKQYREFASQVGRKIAFSRKMNLLAIYYQVSIYHLSGAVYAAWKDDTLQDDPVHYIFRYEEYLHLEGTVTRQQIIADHIKETTKKSWCRFGDRNYLKGGMYRAYLAEYGTPLDVQVQNINMAYELDVTTNELIQFMLDNPNGPKSFKNEWTEKLEEYSDKMRALVDFPLSPDFVHDFMDVFFRPPGQAGVSGSVPF